MSEVIIRVYDISRGMARTMSAMAGLRFDAIYHTGVLVYGKEYFFGGGASAGSGISSLPPATFERQFGIRPIESISIGRTKVSADTFHDFLRQITPQWLCSTYSLLRHNCNHFSDCVCKFLTGKGLPARILNQAEEFLATPLGQSIGPMIDAFSGSMHDRIPGIGGNAVTAPRPLAPSTAAPSSDSKTSISPHSNEGFFISKDRSAVDCMCNRIKRRSTRAKDVEVVDEFRAAMGLGKGDEADAKREAAAVGFVRSALTSIADKKCTLVLPWLYLLRVACLESSLACSLRVDIVGSVTQWTEKSLEAGTKLSDPALLMAYVVLANAFAKDAGTIQAKFSRRLLKLSAVALRSKTPDGEKVGKALRHNLNYTA